MITCRSETTPRSNMAWRKGSAGRRPGAGRGSALLKKRGYWVGPATLTLLPLLFSLVHCAVGSPSKSDG